MDGPGSMYSFLPEQKPFLVTAAVSQAIPHSVIRACLHQLTLFAKKHGGLDYLQSFKVEGCTESLWFIDDGDGGAITALFPTDY